MIDRAQETEEVLVEGSAPKFVRLPTDLLVAEGEDAIFECAVTGEPKPNLRWYSDDGEVTHSERILASIIFGTHRAIFYKFNVHLISNYNMHIIVALRLRKRKTEQGF